MTTMRNWTKALTLEGKIAVWMKIFASFLAIIAFQILVFSFLPWFGKNIDFSWTDRFIWIVPALIAYVFSSVADQVENSEKDK